MKEYRATSVEQYRRGNRVTYLRNTDQQDALFFFNLFQ